MPNDVVISYLHYLQDMSRKIILRSGMEHVLKGTRRTPDYFFGYERQVRAQEFASYLKAVRTNLDKESEKKLFIGFGLVVGNLRRKGLRRKISAPLLFALVDIDFDDDNQRLIHEIQFDSISLNYDLITLMLERDTEPDDETDQAEGQLPFIEQSNLLVLEEIEKEIDAALSGTDLDEGVVATSLAPQIFTTIKQVDAFKQIKMELGERSEERRVRERV